MWRRRLILGYRNGVAIFLLGCTASEPPAPARLPPLPPTAVLTPDPAPIRPDIAEAAFLLTDSDGKPLETTIPAASRFLAEFQWNLLEPASFRNRAMNVCLVKLSRDGVRMIASPGHPDKAKQESNGRFSRSFKLKSPPVSGEFVLIAYYDWEHVLAEQNVTIVPAADSE